MRRAIELRACVLVHEEEVRCQRSGAVLDIGYYDRLMVLLPSRPPLLVRHRNRGREVDGSRLRDGLVLGISRYRKGEC
jgi:hypothetical protein